MEIMEKRLLWLDACARGAKKLSQETKTDTMYSLTTTAACFPCLSSFLGSLVALVQWKSTFLALFLVVKRKFVTKIFSAAYTFVEGQKVSNLRPRNHNQAWQSDASPTPKSTDLVGHSRTFDKRRKTLGIMLFAFDETVFFLLFQRKKCFALW